MLDYFFINVVISTLVILICRITRPQLNFNYRLTTLALVCWLLPFSQLAIYIPNEFADPIVLSSSLISAASENIQNLKHVESQLPWFTVGFYGLVFIGFIRFLWQLYRQQRWLIALRKDEPQQHLEQISEQHGVPIYLVNMQEAGFLIGIFKPRIYMSQQITEEAQMELIIEHEKQHLRNKDNARLLFIKFIESLFWWNPLVKKLATLNYFYIEAKCDDAVSQIVGHQAYTQGFAALLLNQNIKYKNRWVTTISSTANQNIQRLKLLQDKESMNPIKKTVLIASLLSAFTIISIGSMAATHKSGLANTDNSRDNTIGALVDLNYDIRTQTSEDGEIDKLIGTVQYWVNFGETFRHDTTFGNILEITVKDNGDTANVIVNLIEVINDKEEIVATPELNGMFDQKLYIELDNKEVSKSGYSLIIKPAKAKIPENVDAIENE